MADYTKFFSTERVRKSSIRRQEEIDEFYSDRSRIIYCSSFRRLLQKAQVFSLEPNASVRTRLTHSLEVSDIGKTLATKIAQWLFEQKKIAEKDKHLIVSIVENACLLHDIGNPPFGHFGEAAIKDWAQNLEELIPDSIILKEGKNQELLDRLLKDFKEFDGNPQGFRIVTKLHTEQDEYSLNLTYATLLCSLKYVRVAGGEKDEGIRKKAGYFQTEQKLVNEIWERVGIVKGSRYPFTYIMEAADDIAYCLSDISDGIEKNIITIDSFVKKFREEWEKKYPGESVPVDLKKIKNFNFDISIPWSKKAMEEAFQNFIYNESHYLDGDAKSLINESDPMGRVLNVIKSVSRKILYTSIKAEAIELTGYAVITGILKRYERLLKLKEEEFDKILNDNGKGYELGRRLFHRIGQRYVKAYNYAKQELKCDEKRALKEWWLRIHLILDHIAGMTDEFALETYQMLEGINLFRY